MDVLFLVVHRLVERKLLLQEGIPVLDIEHGGIHLDFALLQVWPLLAMAWLLLLDDLVGDQVRREADVIDDISLLVAVVRKVNLPSAVLLIKLLN